ncbi:RNA helicase [Malassezia cuniculi]|uniref:ATP-dependent RNA helicase n=1 Tax=Malassezia cuniculi TaxID=948313 RepID=A0AAF0EXH3_9BASI|nr:RNA helicase [Malassezia cuniculi]
MLALRRLATAARARPPRTPPRTPNRHRLSEIRPGELPALDFDKPDAPQNATKKFESPPLSRGLLAMLQALLGPRARPTTPQAHALAHMFVGGWGARPEPSATLIAAETGSGKTLAYLLPVLQKLHDTKALTEHVDRKYAANGRHKLMPRAIVLAPTHELARQITGVAKALSHHPEHKLRVACTSTPGFEEHIERDLARLSDSGGPPASPDVLVATPGRLVELCIDAKPPSDMEAPQWRPLSLRNLQSVVIDEADTLLDKGFGPTTHALLDAIAPGRVRVDVIFVSATIPKTLTEYLEGRFPTRATLASPQLHTLPEKLRATFVDPGSDRNLAVLREILRIFTTPGSEHDQILIFRDRRGGVESLTSYLRERNVDVVSLTGDADKRSTRTNADLSRFLVDPRKANRPEEGGPRVLVTTSLLSRGLDFGPYVKHVLLPDAGREGTRSAHSANNNALELLHRAGRSARAGRSGQVVIFDRSSAPGKSKLLINRSGKRKGIIRGQMDLLVRELRHGK